MNNYTVKKKNPVAKFYYKGTHSHPVRRTILVVEETSKFMVGYELREGTTVRAFKQSPVKKYLKNEIARYGDYSRLKNSQRNKDRKNNETTLERANFSALVLEGV